MSRPRVLVVAEAANPEWVSVPLVGWSHARALCEVADAHLVTQVRNREAIAATGLRPDVDFTAIDSEVVARRLYALAKLLRGGAGRGWTVVTALDGIAYYYFEHLVWQRFGSALRAGEFDVVHRVTPLSPTTPSLLAARCRRAGVPFVLGPLNGGVRWPKGFDRARRQEFEWLSYARDAYRLLPGYRSTRRSSSAIIIGSQATWADMPEVYRSRCVYVPENAIDPTRLPAVDTHRPRPEPPLRVCFLGRLVPYKGPDMLVEAMLPLLRSGRARLEVIGDGPLLESLRARVDAADAAANVCFHGWLEHSKALEALGRSHVLGLPSIREFGGGVVLEAMAVGVVPVVVAYGGPAELVTPRTGYALPLGSRDDIVAGLRSQLEELADDPTPLAERSASGLRRVFEQFTWAAKARQTLEVYRWVLGQRDRPDFGMPFPDPPEEPASLRAGTTVRSDRGA